MKFKLTTTGLVLAGLIFLFVIERKTPESSAQPVVTNVVTLTVTQTVVVPVAENPAPPATAPTTVVNATNSPEVVAARIEQLQSLAMNSDAASLNAILSDLLNPDPQIRAAAREAAVQFGDSSAAASLRAAVPRVADDSEKIALLEAARYLELPPLNSPPKTNPHPAGSIRPARPQ